MKREAVPVGGKLQRIGPLVLWNAAIFLAEESPQWHVRMRSGDLILNGDEKQVAKDDLEQYLKNFLCRLGAISDSTPCALLQD